MPSEFSVTHFVQFSETDMAGIVHFSNFFRWMEEVEHAYFRSLGLSVSMPHEGRHLGWPRVSVGCDFFGPVRFEDEVQLKLRVTKVGEKSFDAGTALVDGSCGNGDGNYYSRFESSSGASAESSRAYRC